MQIKVKYRALLSMMQGFSITILDLLCEWYSTVTLYQGSSKVFSGVLDTFPEIANSSLDADITLTFQSWLGLCQGVGLTPTQNLQGNLDTLLVNQVQAAINASKVARAPFPIKIGKHIDTLANVTWTVDSFMTLSDFLVQRCDNAEGAAPFDINFTPDGEFEVWDKFGYDTSQDFLFQFGDAASNVETFDFPAWMDYYTDVVMSGAGNGYGDAGNTIISRAYNADSRKRHFYYQKIEQDSSISLQASLDQAATKYLKYAASPASTPTVTINATRLGLKLMEHDQGGDLWVGDSVMLIPEGIYKGLVVSSDNMLRIDQLDITIDAQFMTTVKMTMIDPTGGKVTVAN